MSVMYPSGTMIVYRCSDSRTRRVCQEVNGRHVEPAVEGLVLESLSREELELAVGAVEKLGERAKELDQQWQNRIESARYEADKAARRYYQVEPENRLVARTVESEWNARLEELEKLEKKYEEVRRQPPFELTQAQREKILALSEDLPRLWSAPTSKSSQRKEIVRVLIEDVTLKNLDEPWAVDVAVRWKSGSVSRHQAERVTRYPWTTDSEIVDRIRQLSADNTDEEIADILNAEGYRTSYGKTFTKVRVYGIRSRRGWKKPRGGQQGSSLIH